MLSVKALASLAIRAYLPGPSLLSDAINTDICNSMAASLCFKILYVSSTIIQLNRGGSSLVEPVLS